MAARECHWYAPLDSKPLIPRKKNQCNQKGTLLALPMYLWYNVVANTFNHYNGTSGIVRKQNTNYMYLQWDFSVVESRKTTNWMCNFSFNSMYQLSLIRPEWVQSKSTASHIPQLQSVPLIIFFFIVPYGLPDSQSVLSNIL